MTHHCLKGLISKSTRGHDTNPCVYKIGIADGVLHTPSDHLAIMAPFHSPEMATKGFRSGCKISAVTRFFLPP